MVGLTLSRQPEQNNGRLGGLAQSEDSAEIGVGGYQDAVFLGSAIENLLVIGCGQSIVAYVRRIVPSLPQPL